MNTNDTQAFINALKKPIQEMIRNELSTVVRRESAIVISTDNSAKTAVVRLGTSPDRDDQNMLLPNVTGEDLTVGETVWIDKWGYPSFKAVISLRNSFDSSIR